MQPLWKYVRVADEIGFMKWHKNQRNHLDNNETYP